MIKVSNLTVKRGSGGSKETAIKDLNLSVEKGDSLGVIGPNGCGKTTLLHTLAGLHKKFTGNLQIETTEDRIALILQDVGLLPWKTVWENAVLGQDLGGRGEGKNAKELLLELDLLSYREDFPSQLSGGEKRKLGLARALAVEPEVLLMDEPLVSLDEFTRESLQNKILKLWKDRNLTMALVSHDIEEVSFLGSKIAVLSAAPANLKAYITNKKMGSTSFRRSEEFYQIVQETRRELP
mgnify:CR=1 FL=1